MNRLMLASILPALVIAAGCASPGSLYVHQQSVIRGADAEAVLARATTILQREFGRVRVDQTTRRIMTAPREFTTKDSSGTARDLYRGQSTMRRTATLYISERDNDVVAKLRIDVERLDTTRKTVMQPRGYRFSDNPGAETPIDADAATTEEQNTVWTPVRRDRRLERALLDELRDLFAPAGDGEEGAMDSAPPTEPGESS